MKLKRNVKFDIIIYSCLIVATVLLVMGTKSYFLSLDEYSGLTSEVKTAIKEMKNEEEIVEDIIEKPATLDDINEQELIENHLYNILDNISRDENISQDMIRSWNNFEVINTNYIREITPTYHSYSFDLKIHNLSAKLPVTKKEESTDEYIIITLVANISIKDSKYQVKTIDIPNF